ncbi:ABC transporter permease [Natronogracilivirga saccharolytica]|uniref:ABC transporter permease n=1 Tax=Natronogracilivirga saccharolytica TaxID=2812953 RepID=A0A8J7UU57_9BACT|nr:ABC transporter permease [Natronogracilivirga saccharolytica]MBP3191131.1 ABC transporter permease [Natronogracilivirga saccharolytica]
MSFFKDFFQMIKNQRLRTFMTLFGIVWGTATLIILLAFGMGFRDQMTLNMRGMGDEIMLVFGSQTTKPYQGYGIGRQIRFRESDAWSLKQNIPQISEIAPEYTTSASELRRGDRRNSPHLTGIPENYGKMRNIFAQEGGRWINDRDLREQRRVIFLGDKLKELLFDDEDAIGQKVYVNHTPFTVIGVMQPKSQNSSYNQRDQDRAFIPMTTFSTLFGTDILNNIVLQVEDPRYSTHVKNAIEKHMAHRHRFDPEDTDSILIWDTGEFWSFITYFFLGFNIFMGVIGFVTLAVGGIGVANIMFVAVQERMKEIGIRRSVGARRSSILSHFFGETFLLIGIGALAGYLIGWGIVGAMQFIPIKEFVGTPQFTPGVGLVAFAVLTVIGLAAGWMPAFRASRLNVIECLK